MNLKGALGYSDYLLNDFADDSVLVIGEGTNGGIFQSVMNRPQNVKAVYPLVNRYDF